MFLGILIAACWQHVGFCELWRRKSITYLSSVALRTVALKPKAQTGRRLEASLTQGGYWTEVIYRGPGRQGL